MGFVAVTARIGSTAAPWIAQGLRPTADWLPFVVLGVPSVLGFFVGWPLPETKEKNSSTVGPSVENGLEMDPKGVENSAYEERENPVSE